MNATKRAQTGQTGSDEHPVLVRLLGLSAPEGLWIDVQTTSDRGYEGTQ